MAAYSVRDARRNFSTLITRAMQGESVMIEKRGKAIVCLTPAIKAHARLPALSAFRREIAVKGKEMSDTVIRLRDEERY
jgi:prevent-host-death family protein